MKVWILTFDVDLGVSIEGVYDNPDEPNRIAAERRESDRTTWVGSDGNTYTRPGPWAVQEHEVTCGVRASDSLGLCGACGIGQVHPLATTHKLRDGRVAPLLMHRCDHCNAEMAGELEAAANLAIARACGVAIPQTRFGKPYLDGLIDRLLLPLPSMMASDAQKLMAEAAEMIHQLASRNAGVPACDGSQR